MKLLLNWLNRLVILKKNVILNIKQLKLQFGSSCLYLCYNKYNDKQHKSLPKQSAIKNTKSP